MPGVSTTGVYQQVRRMSIPVANWTGAAVSGAVAYPGLNTTHGLTDGRIPTLPSWVAEQLDGFRAYVITTNGAYYGGVEPYVSFPSYSAAGTDRVQVIVSTNLVDECYARLPNDPPVLLVIFALFKSPHSIEGRGTDMSEGLPAAPVGSLFALPRGGGDTTNLEVVYVDPINGLDTNTGRSWAAAWQTMGRVKTYMEFVGTFQHSLQVMCAAGPVGDWTAARSNFAPEGVRFVGESRVFFIGNPPVRDATNQNIDKRLTIAVGAATITSPRDCDHLRMTPANAEVWQDNQAAPANVALTAADIGKTVRITDITNTNVAYATVSGVDGRGAAIANRWVEINCNHPLFAGGVPAWVSAVGTNWDILDPTDPAGVAASADAQVTAMAGTWNLKNITCTSGSILQTGAIPSKQNCIAHIRFTANPVVLEAADRFALTGSRFEAGMQIIACRDCTSVANAISDAVADRYFPDAIWTAMGFVPVGTADSFGGMGFYTEIATNNGIVNTSECQIQNSFGTIAGLVATGPVAPNNGAVYCTQSRIYFTWMSVGPDGADLAKVVSDLPGGAVYVSNGRLSCQLVGSEFAIIGALSNNSWLVRALNLADDVPTPATAATKVDTGTALTAGLIHADTGGTLVVRQTAVTTIEGINTDNDYGVAVFVGNGCRMYMSGGHDALFYGDHGFLHFAGGSTGYMTGTRTFASKNNALAAADVYVYNATLNCGAVDVWTKNNAVGGAPAGDNTPSPVIWVDHHGNFKLGTPEQGTGLATNGGLISGATGAGNGLDCGALGTVHVNNGSHCTIADFQVNNDDGGAGDPAIVVLNRGFIHHCGENVNSYLEAIGIAAGAVTVGVLGALALGYIPTAEAAARVVRNDFAPAGALSGNEQEVLYRHE